MCEIHETSQNHDQKPSDDQGENSASRTVGARISWILEDRGLSQSDLARKAGIDRADLNRLIHGKRQARSDELQWIAEALGIPLLELVGGVELPERVRATLDAMERLEARALEAELKASTAEAKLAGLERAIETERMTSLQARLDLTQEHRIELSQMRMEHQDELVEVRRKHHAHVEELMKSHELQESQMYQQLQMLEADNQRLRVAVGQSEVALATVQDQVTGLRHKISQSNGAEWLTLLLGGAAGMALGAGLGASSKRR